MGAGCVAQKKLDFPLSPSPFYDYFPYYFSIRWSVHKDFAEITGSKCLRESFRDFGKVYRVGGDEFAVLLHTNANTFGKLMEKLIKTADKRMYEAKCQYYQSKG